jgi:transposase-like protein
MQECTYCEKGYLVQIEANTPYTINHWQCTECDSTFNTLREAREYKEEKDDV